jgi:hypothetical protein
MKKLILFSALMMAVLGQLGIADAQRMTKGFSDLIGIYNERDNNLDRNVNIMKACNNAFNNSKFDIVDDCISYYNNFNRHMDMLANESHNELDKILILGK